MLRKLYVLAVLLCVVVLPYGCAKNPVTGKRQLRLVSEAGELQIGKQQFFASRQMQGGDYELDPVLTEYVNSVGQRLAAVSDRKLPYEFVVVNNSLPNAWTLPGGKIAINRGMLLELNNEAELAAVLAHEIVHAAARHGAQNMERGMFLQGAVMAAGIATGVATGSNDYAKLAVGGAKMAAGLVNQKYGRDAEREADFYGMKYMSKAGYDPHAAVTLQEVFNRLSKDRSTDWLSGLFASHPPSQERLEANRITAKHLPATGELGVERYRHKITYLKKTKKAYDAHDEGRKALSRGNTKKALSLAQNAIRHEPKEGFFHALIGDTYLHHKQYQNALANYNNAVARNNKFFYFLAQRGLIKEKLGDKYGASSDLKRSVDLLPTATVLNSLGNLSLAMGNRQDALRYFSEAATSDSIPGRQAAQSLIRLDLPQNPDKYLRKRIGLNERRYVVIEIGNPTHVTVRNVSVLIRFYDSQGRPMEIINGVRGAISPGNTAIVQTGLGPVQNNETMSRIGVRVVGASVETGF